MQIKSLKIDDYLCLVDFEIAFQTISGGSSTILIGENGTGKSTMIDSILEILISFDSPAIEKQMGYNYEIAYEYAQTNYIIVKSGHRYRIQGNDWKLEGSYDLIRKVLKHRRIFPQRIVAFYSGSNDRMAEIIYRENIQYKKRCRNTLRFFLKSMSDDSMGKIPHFPKRKYNYCDESLTPIYLMAILAGRNSFEKKYLQNTCHFLEIERINLSIDLDKAERIFGRSKYDSQYPTSLYYLIDFIDDRFTELFRRGFLYASFGKGYFEINDLSEVGADTISFLEFFEKLHSLFDAKYEVTVSQGRSSVKVNNMSEGQRQLIKVLGMLGICKSEDSLVLMDEPDAHMNPIWKYEIKETIDKSLQAAINTQAIIATHDPLVINGVSKEFIRVFIHNKSLIENNGFYFTKVIVPTEDTEGLGIDGLLQSEYYGLSTVLDSDAKKKMDRKHDLMIKKSERTLTEPEKQELSELSDVLENMVFARNIPTDCYYDEYVAAMHKIYREQPQGSLTVEDIAERNAKAEEILKGLLGK